MRAIDAVSLVLLSILLAAAVFVLWYNFPTEPVEFEEYNLNLLRGNLSYNSFQFYPSMRYPDKSIGYSIEGSCSDRKKEDFEKAAEMLEQVSILDFYRSDNPQINVLCSNIAPKPEQENHFIAGEGGPTEIINSTKFAVILSGEISLYREETCPEPRIALHELLHALGFDHNKNENSIMYPVTGCDQVIDQEIINALNDLYSEPSVGDVLIESIEANKSGRYLNFNILTANYGLKEVADISLTVSVEDSIIKSFNIENLGIGARKTLTVTNLKIPRDAEEVFFDLRTSSPELTKANNNAIIGIALV